MSIFHYVAFHRDTYKTSVAYARNLMVLDIVERMKLRAPECKRGDDYDHFASWIRRLYNSSSECEKIAREVAQKILKENPNKAFRRMFERIGVI